MQPVIRSCIDKTSPNSSIGVKTRRIMHATAVKSLSVCHTGRLLNACIEKPFWYIRRKKGTRGNQPGNVFRVCRVVELHDSQIYYRQYFNYKMLYGNVSDLNAVFVFDRMHGKTTR
jgi:hypothetical protein